MARYFSLSLSKTFLTTNIVNTTSVRSSARSVTFRSLSSVAPNPDLAGEDPTDPLLSKLEDVIHRIIVRRSAPGWLPFLPGHSYWVPPPRSASRSLGIAQLIEKLANPMSPEESLSTTTVRGWPSSDYFIKGAPPLPDETEVNIISIKLETETDESETETEEDEG